VPAPQAKGDVSIAVADWSLDQHMTGTYAVPVAGSPGRFEVLSAQRQPPQRAASMDAWLLPAP
jgi:hypothetical protein